MNKENSNANDAKLSALLARTFTVLASDALLSPRAAENQIKIIPTTNTDPNLAAARTSSASPRVLDNQVKIVAGKSSAVSPSLDCVRYMSGTPKMISACADHPGAPMPCCSVAAAK